MYEQKAVEIISEYATQSELAIVAMRRQFENVQIKMGTEPPDWATPRTESHRYYLDGDTPADVLRRFRERCETAGTVCTQPGKPGADSPCGTCTATCSSGPADVDPAEVAAYERGDLATGGVIKATNYVTQSEARVPCVPSGLPVDGRWYTLDGETWVLDESYTWDAEEFKERFTAALAAVAERLKKSAGAD